MTSQHDFPSIVVNSSASPRARTTGGRALCSSQTQLLLAHGPAPPGTADAALRYLVTHMDLVVTCDELWQAVWPGLVVGGELVDRHRQRDQMSAASLTATCMAMSNTSR